MARDSQRRINHRVGYNVKVYCLTLNGDVDSIPEHIEWLWWKKGKGSLQEKVCNRTAPIILEVLS